MKGRTVVASAMPGKARIEDPSKDEHFLRTLRDRVRADPQDADALTALGSLLLQRGDAQKALECFNRVTRQNPAYPGIWRLKARAFEALGDAASAEACRKRGADWHS